MPAEETLDEMIKKEHAALTAEREEAMAKVLEIDKKLEPILAYLGVGKKTEGKIAAVKEIKDKGKTPTLIHDIEGIPLKEIKGCDIRSHIKRYGNDNILKIFYAMCQEIKGIDTKGSSIKVTKNWLNFYPDGSNKYFICTKIQKSNILVGLKIKDKLDDPRGKAKTDNSGGYGYNYIFHVDTLKDIDYSIFLIKQAYDQLNIN